MGLALCTFNSKNLWLACDSYYVQGSGTAGWADSGLLVEPQSNFCYIRVNVNELVPGQDVPDRAFSCHFATKNPEAALANFESDTVKAWNRRLIEMNRYPAAVHFTPAVVQVLIVGAWEGRFRVWQYDWWAEKRERWQIQFRRTDGPRVAVIGHGAHIERSLERKPDLLARPSLRLMSNLMLGVCEREERVDLPVRIVRLGTDGVADHWEIREAERTVPRPDKHYDGFEKNKQNMRRHGMLGGEE